MMMDRLLPSLAAPEREAALGTLRALKVYREAHPRQQEAVVHDTGGTDVQALRQARQKASQILSDLK